MFVDSKAGVEICKCAFTDIIQTNYLSPLLYRWNHFLPLEWKTFKTHGSQVMRHVSWVFNNMHSLGLQYVPFFHYREEMTKTVSILEDRWISSQIQGHKTQKSWKYNFYMLPLHKWIGKRYLNNVCKGNVKLGERMKKLMNKKAR